jgi:hypothetical protein
MVSIDTLASVRACQPIPTAKPFLIETLLASHTSKSLLQPLDLLWGHELKLDDGIGHTFVSGCRCDTFLFICLQHGCQPSCRAD